MSDLLRMHSVGSGYGRLQVLWDVSLHVGEGETVVLLGPNGAGKTTAIRTAVGLTAMHGGTVSMSGQDVSRVPYHRRLRGAVAWVPEGRLLFADLTVYDNLHLSARQAGTAKQLETLLGESLALFPDLEGKLGVPAGLLSGGQQQMVAIARALVRAPRLVLLDEPSLGLAPVVTRELRRAVDTLAQRGVATLIAEQNTEWLRGLRGRAYFLQGGRVVDEGDMELMESPDVVRRVYLGLSS